MSNEITRVTRVPEDAVVDGPDLSRFLARHHVALIVIDGPHRGAEYPIRRERTVLGRSRKADLVFDEDTLSREHAAIRYEWGRFVLEDLGSANGCRHNGRVAHEVDIVHGDTIQMGRVRMKFILEAREPDPKTQILDVD
jgi:pSer/pThr/pTyr-binding forkhead associated (FHA) protein